MTPRPASSVPTALRTLLAALDSPPVSLLIAVLLLWLVFAQSARSGVLLSITTDEGLHITSGYSILRTGQFRLIEEHPPLVKALEAAPLLLMPDLPSPATISGWEEGNLPRVMKRWLLPYQPFDRIVYAARVPAMLLALLLGATVFRWAADLGGRRAGLLALGLYALDPNILAHAPLAATDLGSATFIFLSSYLFWRCLRRPTRLNAALAGVALGLAQSAKISALILLPVFVLLAALRALQRDPELFARLWRGWARTAGPRERLVRMGLLAGLIFVIAAGTLWAAYGFEVRTPPGWSVPLPAASHLMPVQRVRTDLAAGRTTFLMGQLSEQGWWYYFPVTFAVKTPLPTLLLLAMAVAGWAVRAGRARRIAWDDAALIVFPLVYWISAMTQPFNIGYRHLLPTLPFMFAFIGVQIAGRRSQSADSAVRNEISRPHLRQAWGAAAVVAVLAWNAVGVARIWPNELTYFNLLAGGPEGGYRYLVDSNLDWGQAWKQLKTYMDTHGIARIKFAQASSNDPAVYSIDYEPIAPMKNAAPILPARFNPAPGVYVISASALQGVALADPNMYDYFRHRPPLARIGYALFVYEVQPQERQGAWAATCGTPAPPLEAQDVTEGLGRDDLRLIYFDCAQTWVMPGGAAGGWFILPYGLAHDPAAFARRWFEPAALTFEQRQSFALPPHSIVRAAATLPAMDGMRPISAAVGSTLELVGYNIDQSRVGTGRTVELLTTWRVIGPPPGPLSIMAHLTTDDGRVVAVGDGLGLSAEQWQVGDVFVQRSLLPIPADAPAGALWVETGLYTLDANARRLPVQRDGQPGGDILRLQSLTLKQ